MNHDLFKMTIGKYIICLRQFTLHFPPLSVDDKTPVAILKLTFFIPFFKLSKCVAWYPEFRS